METWNAFDTCRGCRCTHVPMLNGRFAAAPRFSARLLWFYIAFYRPVSRVDSIKCANISSSQRSPTGMLHRLSTSKDFGMIPLSSGGSGYPSIVWVFPAPVWNTA